MDEREAEVRRRMAQHELYLDAGPGLDALTDQRIRGKELAAEYNATSPRDDAGRAALLRRIFDTVGADVWIEPPLHVAYGRHTSIVGWMYANTGLTIIDDSPVRIGSRVMFGPHVTISTAGHPVHPDLRSDGRQFSAPVTIEDDVWVGGDVSILPGVTIGRGSVVAAGAVVTGNVPPMTIVGGVPARVLRPITDADRDWAWRPPRDLPVPTGVDGVPTPVDDVPGPVEAVLWDLDGVLVDSEALLFEAERQLFAEQGIQLTAEVKAGFVGLGGTEVLAALAAHYGVEPDLPRWVERKMELVHALYPQLQAFEATSALVRELAAVGMPMAVASGSPLSAIDASLAAVGLSELLPERVSVDQVGAGKPAPDVFLAAARRLGAAPERCVVIEDAVPGVLAAKAAGMRCIAIPSIVEPLDPRFERADLLVRGGMPAADATTLLTWLGVR